MVAIVWSRHLNILHLLTDIRVLVVNSLHFVQKHFRHQGTKTQSLIFTNSFALCLCALVAIISVYPG
jgi:hypothetical protein